MDEKLIKHNRNGLYDYINDEKSILLQESQLSLETNDIVDFNKVFNTFINRIEIITRFHLDMGFITLPEYITIVNDCKNIRTVSLKDISFQPDTIPVIN
jgi:hypothetical protein